MAEDYDPLEGLAELFDGPYTNRKSFGPKILKDSDGHGPPTAANPFIYKHGTGRPDEPPISEGQRIEIKKPANLK